MGAADGYDAVAQCRSEGARSGGVCFLDLSALLQRVPAAADPRADTDWHEYYKGWVGAVLDSRLVRPGTRCRDADAPAASAVARRVFAERRRFGELPPFWVIAAGNVAPAAASLEPPIIATDECGAPWRACLWETSQTIDETFGDAALSFAPCHATRGDPSFEISTLDPATYAAALRQVDPGPASSRSCGSALEARDLVEACLGALGKIQGSGAPPFPNGVATVEVETSWREGALDVRIRLQSQRPEQR
jgi:hypothetical protein